MGDREGEGGFDEELERFDDLRVRVEDVADECVGPRRSDRRDGGEAVDRDPVAVDLGGETGREPLERGLRRAVGRAREPQLEAGIEGRSLRVLRGGAGDVHDPPGLAFTHRGEDRLGEVDRGVDVQLEDQAAALQRHLGCREVERGRGVVDEDVDGAELRGNEGHDPGPVLGVGEVGLHRQASAALGLDRGHGLA